MAVKRPKTQSSQIQTARNPGPLVAVRPQKVSAPAPLRLPFQRPVRRNRPVKGDTTGIHPAG